MKLTLGKISALMGSQPSFLIIYAVMSFLGVLLMALTLGWIHGYQGGMDWNSTKEPQFNIHIFLMTLGFLFLQGHGAVVYRLAAKFPKWNLKVIHAAIMFIAIFLCSIGVYVAFDNHKLNGYPDLASVHSWVGLFTYIVFILQWILGFAAFLLPWTPIKVRATWLPQHVFAGTSLLFLCSATALTGIMEYACWYFNCNKGKNGEGELVGLLSMTVLILVCTTWYLLNRGEYKRVPLPND